MAGKKKVARRKEAISPEQKPVEPKNTSEIVIGHVTKRAYYNGRIIDPNPVKTVRVICPVDNGIARVPSWLEPVERETPKSLFDDE